MIEFIILLFLGIFIILYRKNPGENVYKFFITTASEAYEKYAPYSFKTVRAKAKELGQEFTTRQYISQIVIFNKKDLCDHASNRPASDLPNVFVSSKNDCIKKSS